MMCYVKMCHTVTTHPITCPHAFVLHRLWNIIISVSHLSENHVTYSRKEALAVGQIGIGGPRLGYQNLEGVTSGHPTWFNLEL